MPGRDLTVDRLRMQALAKGAHVPIWADQKQVEQMIKDLEDGKVDWGDDAWELTQREKRGYPNSAYCASTETKNRWGQPHSKGQQHYVANPTRQRKMVGTRRVGNKGSKMPTRAKCSGCEQHVILVDNMVDHNWPLYITKLVITEWP